MRRTCWIVAVLSFAAGALPAWAGLEAARELLRPGATFLVAASSEVAWEVDATLSRIRSRTGKLEGTTTVVDGNDDLWTLDGSVVVDARSFTTGSAKRDRTLREESLDVRRHPRIVFVPRRLYRTSSWAEDAALAIEGDLTIRDVTRPVTVPVTLDRRESRLVVDGRVDLAWSDYGIPDPSTLLQRVGPHVRVRVHLELRPSR